LYRVIKRLMDATFATQDQGLKVLPASLEYQARLCKQEIEGRLEPKETKEVAKREGREQSLVVPFFRFFAFLSATFIPI
jgi:hypothetical protein